MIKKCVCRHAYQDKMYGDGNRVCNQKSDGYRCTVCGKEVVSLSKDKKK